jgi:hypothetical protein
LETVARLGDELCPVEFQGERRLAPAGLDWNEPASDDENIHFLPPSDAYLALDRAVLLPESSGESLMAPLKSRIYPRVFNSLTGRIVMRDAVFGAWGRVKERLTLASWTQYAQLVGRALEVAESMSGPLGKPVAVRVLQP